VTRGSIRLRLWSAAAISIVLALAVAGVGLVYLFERDVERRVQNDLAIELNEIISATSYAADGTLTMPSEPTDPRYAMPLSGRYWQVEDLSTHALLRSRSLWDSTLALPPAAEGERRFEKATGPGGALLLIVERTIVDASGRRFRVAVAQDHQTITDSVREYMGELAPALLLLAAALLIAIFVQITVGLAPLQGLRMALRDVVARRTARLDAAVPREVAPLAEEINRLLDAQDKALVRARSRATDLAHGLKTPLQVLSGDIRQLRDRGEATLAADIERSAGAIQRHIERELARARTAPGVVSKAACRPAEVAAGVVAVVRRTPRGDPLRFDIDIADDLVVPVDEGDLSEILGNLVENAARFAASAVRISVARGAAATAISVADDGPGIADRDREAAVARGVRLDQSEGGTGLGLAIVSDIAEAYGGTLALADARPGLVVTITLPFPAGA
jgi:signal transduction histidine kinase